MVNFTQIYKDYEVCSAPSTEADRFLYVQDLRLLCTRRLL